MMLANAERAGDLIGLAPPRPRPAFARRWSVDADVLDEDVLDRRLGDLEAGHVLVPGERLWRIDSGSIPVRTWISW